MDNKEFLDYTGLQHYTEKVQTFVNTKIDNIVLKHNTEAVWAQATDFRPLDGEIVIYDIDETHPYLRYKRGRPVLYANAETGEPEVRYTTEGVLITMLLSELPFESFVYVGTEEGLPSPAQRSIGMLWLDTTPDAKLTYAEEVEF